MQHPAAEGDLWIKQGASRVILKKLRNVGRVPFAPCQASAALPLPSTKEKFTRLAPPLVFCTPLYKDAPSLSIWSLRVSLDHHLLSYFAPVMGCYSWLDCVLKMPRLPGRSGEHVQELAHYMKVQFTFIASSASASGPTHYCQLAPGRKVAKKERQPSNWTRSPTPAVYTAQSCLSPRHLGFSLMQKQAAPRSHPRDGKRASLGSWAKHSRAGRKGSHTWLQVQPIRHGGAADSVVRGPAWQPNWEA